MLNSVCLMGRLVADPELRTTPSGVSVCSFRMAVDRNYQTKGQDKQTDFINIVVWRERADFVSRYFHKGSMVVVQGSIRTENYTDKDGNKRSAFHVQADNVMFGESKSAAGNSQGGYAPASSPNFGAPSAPAYNESKPAFSTANAGDFEEIVGDEDLPF